MIDNKKDLMEVFGLTATLAMKLEEFEKDADFAIAKKAIKTVYTKMKNDLGRLFFEIKKRQEDVCKLSLIRNDVAVITRAKLISKFDELKKKEEQEIQVARVIEGIHLRERKPMVAQLVFLFRLRLMMYFLLRLILIIVISMSWLIVTALIFHGIVTGKHSNCYRDWETDRKSTRLNSSHSAKSRMPSSA